MTERIPRPGELYRHFKGKLYQIVTVAEHTETGEQLVVYQAMYGTYRVYARPLAMFMSKVEREKYPDAEQTYRFERVEPDAGSGGAETEAGGLSGRDGTGDGLQTGAAGSAGLNPRIADFAEAEDYGRKLEVFSAMRRTVTQADLDVICELLDLQPSGGGIREQADSVESYLKMQLKYSGTRLR